MSSKSDLSNRLILYGREEVLSGLSLSFEQDRLVGLAVPGSPSGREIVCRDSSGREIYRGCAIDEGDISSRQFDYLVIADPEIVHRGYGELTGLGIPHYRILTYESYSGDIRGRSFYAREAEAELISYLEKLHIRKVLDADLFFAHGSEFVNGEEHFKGMKLYGWHGTGEKGLFPIYDNLYEKVYSSPEEFRLKMYDALLFSEYREAEEIIRLLQTFGNCARYFIFRFKAGSSSLEKFRRIRFMGTVQQWQPCLNGVLCIFNVPGDKSVKIRVVMHKPAVLPLLDAAYYPIQAGRKNGRDMGIDGDDSGTSVSELNPLINELTVLYWQWKNEKADIVGLVHYRRYFLKCQVEGKEAELFILGKDDIRDILRDYDIILGKKHYYGLPYGNAMNILWHLDVSLYEKSLTVVRKWISLRQPEYMGAFDFVMNHQGFYRCNMFVARKNILDAYAEWLFSFLLEAVQEFDYQGLSDGDRRIMGYWGEILINVWLVRQHLASKELPIWQC